MMEGSLDLHFRPTRRYALAITLVLVAFGLRALLDPVLGEHFTYYSFYFAVLVATAYGGYGPGLLAMVLGLLCGSYFFSMPRYSFLVEASEGVSAFRFVSLGCALVLVVGRLNTLYRKSRVNAESHRRAEQVCWAQYAEQKQMLSRTTSERDRFLATVSQELREPMVPAVDPLLVLERTGGEASAAVELLREHRQRSDAFVHVLGKVVEFCSPLTRPDVRPAVVDLRSIIGGAVDRQGTRITVRMDVPLEPVKVSGDHARLARMMEKLLERFAADGSDRKVVDVVVHVQDREAVIMVAGAGAGHTEPWRPMIDELFRIDPNDPQDGQTTVLDIMIAARDAGTSGGSLLMRGTLQAVPQFMVRLPVVEHGDPMAPALPVKGRSRTSSPSPARVVIADAQRAYAEPLAVILNAQRHAAFAIPFDEDMLLQVIQARPDIAFLDLDLIKDASQGMVRSMRAAGPGSARLVGLFSRDDGDALLHARRLGLDGLIAKPLPLGRARLN
jgi:K+-sensing histidine kinase KdpD